MERSEAASERSLHDMGGEVVDPFALFMKGQAILARLRRRDIERPRLDAARLLERQAWSLMLVGRELESASVNEELIGRFGGQAEASSYVVWARFNAGCAYARIGIVEKAAAHLASAARDAAGTGDDHDLMCLAGEGMRQTEDLARQLSAHRRGARASRFARERAGDPC